MSDHRKTFGLTSYGDTYEEAKQATLVRLNDLQVKDWEEHTSEPSNNGCTCERCSRWSVGAKWEE